MINPFILFQPLPDMSSKDEYLRSVREDNEMASKNEDLEEPVICSKCNATFRSDSEYMHHYNENHKADGTVTARKILVLQGHLFLL